MELLVPNDHYYQPPKKERIRSVQLQSCNIVLLPLSKLESLVPNDHYYHKFVVFLEHSDPDLLVAGTKQFDQGIVDHVVETPPQIHLQFVYV